MAKFSSGGPDAAASRHPHVLSMVLLNDRRELAGIGERVERFAATCGLSGDDCAAVNLVLDELVSNIIKYGYDDDGEHRIAVVVEVDGGVLTVSVDDDGKPFNPIEIPPPDLERPIEERPIGGLGVYIVRSLADTLDYRREHGHNIVTL